MQRADALEPDAPRALVEDRVEALLGADVIARREQVAGVQAEPEPLVAAGGLDERRELRERAAERAARAGGVLEVQRAALGLRQRLGDDLARAARSPAPTSPASAEPGCSTTACAPSAAPARSELVSEASDFAADLRVRRRRS